MNKLVLNIKTLFLIGLAIFALASCDKDEEVVQEADLVASWAIESSSVDVMFGELTIEQYVSDVLGFSGMAATIAAEEMENGFDEEITGTIVMNEDHTYVSNIGDDVEETGTWALSTDGKELTLTPEIGDDVVVLEVVSADSNSLVLNLREEVQDDLSGDGTDEIIVINMTINLAK